VKGTVTPSGPYPATPIRYVCLLMLCAATVLMIAGGCALLQHHPAGPASDPYDDSAHPLTDEQAKAQVVDPARRIVSAASLDGVDGGFSFESCNDQGEPPYRGRVSMTFLIHGEADTYFQTVAHAMTLHGWNQGAPPGQHFFGTALNEDGVTANITYLPSDHAYGEIFLLGQCRNTTDHRHDGRITDITGLLGETGLLGGPP
jgi:hypothetical protein